MKTDTDFRFAPTWCEFCERPANYCAERLNGSAVDVCDMQKHSIRLTGRYHRIRSQKTAKERKEEQRLAHIKNLQELGL